MVVLSVAATGAAALAVVPAANAATITGGGSFVGDAGSTRIVDTLGAALNCASSRVTGSIGNGTYVPPATVGTAVLSFTGCIGPTGVPFTVVCNTTTPAVLKITGNPVGGTTAGSITGIDCVVTMLISPPCTAKLTGSVPVSYTNPTGSTNGRLTVLAAGQSLTFSNSTCQFVVLVGAADFGAPVGVGLGFADLGYPLTTTGPTIT